MSCGNLLSRWLTWYDPIHRGMTPRGIANGGMTTVGWFFPRVQGGFNLYRGFPTANDVDYGVPVGAAGIDVTEIKNFSWYPHQPNTNYYYAIKSINGGGVESVPADLIWPTSFDGSVLMKGEAPHSPGNFQISLLSGGRFKLGWTYDERDQWTPPSEFRLYHDNGSGTVDYNVIRATVPYVDRQHDYEYTSGGFSHDALRIWSVRSASVLGVTDLNMATISARADAQGPPNHPAAYAECGAEV